MQFLELQKALKDFPVFSIHDLHMVDHEFHNQRLAEWQARGYLRKVCKGYYMFADQQVDEYTLFRIANTIYRPSYISLEMALSHYGLIPEAVYRVTSVTSRRTATLETGVGVCSYRHVRPAIMFGYDVRHAHGVSYAIAEPEKAILDLLYLNADLDTRDALDGLRINVDMCREMVRADTFERYLLAFDSRALKKRATLFIDHLHA